jgi:hypothetical protein
MGLRSDREELILPYDILSIEPTATRIEFTYEAGNLKTLKFYKNMELKVTLTFTYDAGGNLIKIERS